MKNPERDRGIYENSLEKKDSSPWEEIIVVSLKMSSAGENYPAVGQGLKTPILLLSLRLKRQSWKFKEANDFQELLRIFKTEYHRGERCKETEL